MLAAFWPAVLLAARRSTPRLGARRAARGGGRAARSSCVLAQSRGSLLAGPSRSCSPWRSRASAGACCCALSAVALTTLARAARPARRLRRRGGSGSGTLGRAGARDRASRRAAARRRARLRAAATGACTLGPRRPPLRRRARRVAGSPSRRRGRVAAAAPGPGSPVAPTSGRYDFWRVAAGQFARAPAAGRRRGQLRARLRPRAAPPDEEPLYPHSIICGTLGQTGLVGACAALGFLGRGRPRALARCDRERSRSPRRRAAAAWLAQASIDWLWELPAVAAPAIAFLGLVAGLSIAAGAERAPPRAARCGAASRSRSPVARGRLLRPAGARGARDRARRPALGRRSRRRVARARAGTRARPAQRPRGRHRRRAGARDGDRRRARRAFGRALARDRATGTPQAQLALVDLREGRRSAAATRLARAHLLNPLEPAIAAALERRAAAAPGAAAGRAAAGRADRARADRPAAVDCRPVLGLASACARRTGA